MPVSHKLENFVSRIALTDLRVDVRIGCTDTERSEPQPVSISVELWFDSTVPGMQTDQLEDTVCYGTLTRKIRELVEAREFCLIEHVAGRVFEVAGEVAGANRSKLGKVEPSLIEVTVMKPSRGASFTYRAAPSRSH